MRHRVSSAVAAGAQDAHAGHHASGGGGGKKSGSKNGLSDKQQSNGSTGNGTKGIMKYFSRNSDQRQDR